MSFQKVFPLIYFKRCIEMCVVSVCVCTHVSQYMDVEARGQLCNVCSLLIPYISFMGQTQVIRLAQQAPLLLPGRLARPHFYFYFLFETVSHNLGYPGTCCVELMVVLLPQSPECWNYWCASPYCAPKLSSLFTIERI